MVLVLASAQMYKLHTFSPILWAIYLLCWLFPMLCRRFLFLFNPIYLFLLFSFVFLNYIPKCFAYFNVIKNCLLLSSSRVWYYVSFESYTKFLIHFEISFFFLIARAKHLISTFCMWKNIQLSQRTLYWKDFSFFAMCSWHLCWKSVRANVWCYLWTFSSISLVCISILHE